MQYGQISEEAMYSGVKRDQSKPKELKNPRKFTGFNDGVDLKKRPTEEYDDNFIKSVKKNEAEKKGLFQEAP